MHWLLANDAHVTEHVMRTCWALYEHVMGMLCAQLRHVIRTSCGAHVVRMWYACDDHVVGMTPRGHLVLTPIPTL